MQEICWHNRLPELGLTDVPILVAFEVLEKMGDEPTHVLHLPDHHVVLHLKVLV